jgi:hypothetical protein
MVIDVACRIVQHDIARRCTALILGPAVAEAGFDFVEDLRKRAISFLRGLETVRIAGIGPHAIECAVLPARRGSRRFQIIARARLSDHAGELAFGQCRGRNLPELGTIGGNIVGFRHRSGNGWGQKVMFN